MIETRKNLNRRLFLSLAASQCAALPLSASAIPAGLRHYGTGQLNRQHTFTHLELRDGTALQLIGLNRPLMAGIGVPKWQSELATDRLVYGGDGRRQDRYGRIMAHVYTDRGEWLQGLALQRGWAQVETLADNRALAGDMLKIERQARQAAAGLWANHTLRVLAHDNHTALFARGQNGFRIVEGRIVKVAISGRYLYFNFGTDYRRDFTLVADARARRQLQRENFDYTELEGRLVRVRGWVRYWNGPAMGLTHPEQIEVLDR